MLAPAQHQYRLDCRTGRWTMLSTILASAMAFIGGTALNVILPALESGADDYLTKPFQLYELELRIQNAIQKKEKLRNRLVSEILSSEPNSTLPKVQDQFLSALYRFLDENLGKEQLSVDLMAQTMAMSRSTLNRKLKALLGVSGVELMKRNRIQKAAALIAAGESISRVSYQLGFDSPSYFWQCFKEDYKMTPLSTKKNIFDGFLVIKNS